MTDKLIHVPTELVWEHNFELWLIWWGSQRTTHITKQAPVNTRSCVPLTCIQRLDTNQD